MKWSRAWWWRASRGMSGETTCVPTQPKRESALRLGGCADPTNVIGSPESTGSHGLHGGALAKRGVHATPTTIIGAGLS